MLAASKEEVLLLRGTLLLIRQSQTWPVEQPVGSSGSSSCGNPIICGIYNGNIQGAALQQQAAFLQAA